MIVARFVDADKLKALIDDEWMPDMAVSEIWKIIDKAETVEVEALSEDEKKLIMNVVQTALSARKPQYINVDTKGYVSVHPVQKSATLVEEKDRAFHWHCSACRSVYGIASRLYNYCPECGAKIEGDCNEKS